MLILWDRNCEYGVFQITLAINSLQITCLRLVIWQDFWHLWFGKPHTHTIASMPSLLCRLQILIGGSSDSIFRTVVHTVRELQLWSKEIEWRHPSTKGSYCDSHFLLTVLSQCSKTTQRTFCTYCKSKISMQITITWW